MKQKLKAMKRVFSLAIAVILVLTVAACTKPLSPMETLEKATEKTVDKWATSGASDALTKISNGGSIELSGDLSEIFRLATGFPIPLSASAKIYADSDAPTPAEAFTFNIGVQDVTIFDMLMYINADYFAVKSNSLIGDDAYGINYDNALENFNSSIFGPNGPFSLGEEFYEYIGTLSSASSIYDEETIKSMEKALEDFSKEMKPILYKSIESNGHAEVVAGTVTLGENEIKTDDVTLTFSVNDALTFAKETLNALKDSKTLKPLWEAYFDLMSSYSYQYGYDSIPTADEAYEDVMELIDQALAEIDELDLSDEEISNVTFNVVISISNKDGTLVALNFSASDDDDNGAKITVTLPSSASSQWKFSINANDGGDLHNFDIIYDVTEDTEDKFSFELNSNLDNTATKLISFSWDKNNGDYLFEVYGTPEYTYAPVDNIADLPIVFGVKGNYSTDESSETFTVTDITFNGDAMSIGEIALILTYTDTMPVIDTFNDLLTMTESEFKALVSQIADAINALQYAFLA